MDILTSALLDKQYLLLGADRGLYFVDLAGVGQLEPHPLIRNVRFKKIEISLRFNILIGLSGKHDHVRQYSLPAIRKLILYLQGQDPILLESLDFTVPIHDIKQESWCDSEYKTAHSAQNNTEISLVALWTNDFIKLTNTALSKDFIITETEKTAFMSVIFKQEVMLLEWAYQPYNRFMKLKGFWMPESPKFIEISQDGIAAKYIYIGYSNELNLIHIDDSNVKQIKVHSEFSQTESKKRWRNYSQYPFSESRIEQMVESNKGMMRPSGKSKLGAAVSNTVEHGIESAEHLFFATYNRITKTVNKFGEPVLVKGASGWKAGKQWAESVVALIQRPFETLIGVGKNMVEIVDWDTVEVLQRLHVDASGSLKVIGSGVNSTVISVSGKKKGSMLYLMGEKSAPAYAPGTVYNRIIRNITSQAAVPSAFAVLTLETLGSSDRSTSFESATVKESSTSSTAYSVNKVGAIVKPLPVPITVHTSVTNALSEESDNDNASFFTPTSVIKNMLSPLMFADIQPPANVLEKHSLLPSTAKDILPVSTVDSANSNQLKKGISERSPANIGPKQQSVAISEVSIYSSAIEFAEISERSHGNDVSPFPPRINSTKQIMPGSNSVNNHGPSARRIESHAIEIEDTPDYGPFADLPASRRQSILQKTPRPNMTRNPTVRSSADDVRRVSYPPPIDRRISYRQGAPQMYQKIPIYQGNAGPNPEVQRTNMQRQSMPVRPPNFRANIGNEQMYRPTLILSEPNLQRLSYMPHYGQGHNNGHGSIIQSDNPQFRHINGPRPTTQLNTPQYRSYNSPRPFLRQDHPQYRGPNLSSIPPFSNSPHPPQNRPQYSSRPGSDYYLVPHQVGQVRMQQQSIRPRTDEGQEIPRLEPGQNSYKWTPEG